MPQSEQMSELLMSESVGPLVDLDHPMDFAVATTGVGMRLRALGAVSAGVKDVDAAKGSLADRYKLVPWEDQTTLVQGLGGHRRRDDSDEDDSDEDRNDRACVLAPPPAEGASGRLVCGWDRRGLSELEPWLSRTPSTATSKPDLHADLRMEPLKPTILALKRMFSMVLGNALGGRLGASSSRDLALSVGGDAVDFALDLDAASVDVDLADVTGVSIKAKVQLSSVSSGFARLITAHPDGGSPPPGAFWQLPPDTDVAAFERGIDPDLLARARDLALDAISSKLEEEGLQVADRKAVAEAFAKLLSPAPALYARGLDAEAQKKSFGVTKSLPPTAATSEILEAKRTVEEALLGWHLIAFDEPPTRLATALTELTNAWDRPGLLASYRSAHKGRPAPSLRSLPTAKSAALPRGTQHFALEIPLEQGPDKPNSRVKVRPLAVHAFLLSEGTRTWLGIGGDEALVVSKLVSVLAAGQGVVRPELAALKERKLGAGGFVTARGVAEFVLLVQALAGEYDLGLESLDELSQLPHRGETPTPFSLTARPGTQMPTVDAELQLPLGVVEDTIQAAIRHGGF
jgi:hypothetical protein